MLADDERPIRSCQQRVAVGLRLGDHLRPEVLCSTGPVLDNDRLTPASRELISEDSREAIQNGTGGCRHYDFDRALGIISIRNSKIGSGQEQRCENPATGQRGFRAHDDLHLFRIQSFAATLLPNYAEPRRIVMGPWSQCHGKFEANSFAFRDRRHGSLLITGRRRPAVSLSAAYAWSRASLDNGGRSYPRALVWNTSKNRC